MGASRLIRSYLKSVGSGLHAVAATVPFAELCRQMAIADGPDERIKPRNVGLLFFNDSPEEFFPYARIEIVHLPQGAAGDRIEEHVFRGPLDHQLRAALRHLRSRVVTERITKLPDRAEAPHTFSYPFKALEEALVNAVYHRGYDVREPIEVRINPGSVEILSYPGPDLSIRPAALRGDRILSRRYRNRRIGEFLKELDLTEGRFTGIPKIRAAMRANGSPPPNFVTDDGRTFFAVELPIHPDFAGEAHDEAHDAIPPELSETEHRILAALRTGPKSVPQIAGELGYESRSGHFKKAVARLDGLVLIAMTIPAKPKSKNQKRSLTPLGRRVLLALS